MPFDREQLQTRMAGLAAQGVYLGTSSWKYEGWIGLVYTPDRYAYRGRLARTRFERDCLAEYGEVFRTVSVDATYYAFPREQFLRGLAAAVPEDFRFGLKVTDAITIRRFPKVARFGDQAGKPNAGFLDAELFGEAFLRPCEAIRDQVGVLIFEFSRFWPDEYANGQEFLADLDRFLGRLPRGWPYGIELRNRGWLGEDYFACLQQHQVAHVFNSWEAMPAVGVQLALAGSRTSPSLTAARFLLTPGRRYEETAGPFQPYDRVVAVDEEARQAGAALIREGLGTPDRRTFLFVNNRLEGCAPETIAAMVERAGG